MHLLATLVLSAALTTLPATPLIETARGGQSLNFDLVLENDGETKLVIDQIEATVLDANGAMVTQRRVQGNGASILTIPRREVEPHKKLVIFNPFHTFESDLALSSIRYDVTFEDGSKTSITVAPKKYEQKTNLMLPVSGRVFVHDGHDFYSHHRRLDVTGDMTTALGINANMTRYAYDFVLVDGKGSMHRGSGEENEEWYGWGSPILAPADGVVVRAAGDRADSTKAKPVQLDFQSVLEDLTLIFGNFALIDHGNGEFSMLAHMKQGSVTLEPGDRVKRGQKVGEMGRSGDAMFPHLHYQLQRDAHFGEGLPSYFRDYKRFTGASWVRVALGQIDTGDVVETTKR
ncbi:MAG TPA: M23 family metallopeptidase [Thermoanaerobaculia bacterium]|nr:M23 family metallopeptidase [Thermoanaerobaculia bacterium]